MIQKAIDEISVTASKKFKENIQNLSTERFGSVNKIIKYLAENNVFGLKNDRLIFNDANLPKGQMQICNTKTKMILKIKNACEQTIENSKVKVVVKLELV